MARMRRNIPSLPHKFRSMMGRSLLPGNSSGAPLATVRTPATYVPIQRPRDVEVPLSLNPRDFLWGSPGHYMECFFIRSNQPVFGNLSGYAVHLNPQEELETWQGMELLLGDPHHLSAPLLSDLMEMGHSLRRDLLEETRIQARKMINPKVAQSHGPIRRDYVQAFCSLVSSMPMGTFPATEDKVHKLVWGSVQRSPYVPTGSISLSPSSLSEHLAECIGKAQSRYISQSHYTPMGDFFSPQLQASFLLECQGYTTMAYLAHIRGVLRQLGNLGEISRLPFNQEQGTWSSYLENRANPDEWRNRGYHSIDSLSSMAEELHDLVVELYTMGQRDRSSLMPLFQHQETMGLDALLTLRDLWREYNLDWAMASMEWDATALSPGERRNTPLENDAHAEGLIYYSG